MNIKEFESKLSDKELKEFKENFNIPSFNYEDFILLRKSFALCISGAFAWDITPKGQGNHYWYNISKR